MYTLSDSHLKNSWCKNCAQLVFTHFKQRGEIPLFLDVIITVSQIKLDYRFKGHFCLYSKYFSIDLNKIDLKYVL